MRKNGMGRTTKRAEKACSGDKSSRPTSCFCGAEGRMRNESPTNSRPRTQPLENIQRGALTETRFPPLPRMAR